MTPRRQLALMLILSSLAAGCVPGRADPATPKSPASAAPTTSTTTQKPDIAKTQEAAVSACDVFREALDHIHKMSESSTDVFGKTMDFTVQRDTFYLSKFVWIDKHWGDRIAEATTPDVPENVRRHLNKVVETNRAAIKTQVQHRADSEYKPAAFKESLALQSADQACNNYR